MFVEVMAVAAIETKGNNHIVQTRIRVMFPYTGYVPTLKKVPIDLINCIYVPI